MGEFLDRLRRVKCFTQLDLTGAYHWMRIKEGDEGKTAFRTRYSHFKYQMMLFGLSNAPASFQGYISKILTEKLDVFVIVYLDDILIYINNIGQAYVNAICWVLNKLRKHSLFANLKNCCFQKDEIWFLGYFMSARGIEIEMKEIKSWRIGQNRNQWERFKFFLLLPISIDVSSRTSVRLLDHSPQCSEQALQLDDLRMRYHQ